jgi:hypothetical protein
MIAAYCLPGADPDMAEPFAARLSVLLERFGGQIMVMSGRRTYAEQQRLYAAYLAGGNLAAKPGASNHERGLAADLDRTDGASLPWVDVHRVAATVGLCFPLYAAGLGEPWHVEADPTWVDPTEEVLDMTRQELAEAFGGSLDTEGRIVIPLADGNLYPVGNILGFIHGELPRPDLLLARMQIALGS